MAKQFTRIESDHRDFILRQRVFFVGSAAATGRVNLSPKGLDSFRIMDESRVAYLDMTGSGSETSAHLIADGRLTVMFCAFEGPPLILRLYGQGQSHWRGSEAYGRLLATHFSGPEPLSARQIVTMRVELVQTSCGFGVPLMDFIEQRPALPRVAEQRGLEGMKVYRREKNAVSMDGLPTGLPDE
jgi:hypothetical protein